MKTKEVARLQVFNNRGLLNPLEGYEEDCLRSDRRRERRRSLSVEEKWALAGLCALWQHVVVFENQ